MLPSALYNIFMIFCVYFIEFVQVGPGQCNTHLLHDSLDSAEEVFVTLGLRNTVFCEWILNVERMWRVKTLFNQLLCDINTLLLTKYFIFHVYTLSSLCYWQSQSSKCFIQLFLLKILCFHILFEGVKTPQLL